jgi:hypothetical protein
MLACGYFLVRGAIALEEAVGLRILAGLLPDELSAYMPSAALLLLTGVVDILAASFGLVGILCQRSDWVSGVALWQLFSIVVQTVLVFAVLVHTPEGWIAVVFFLAASTLLLNLYLFLVMAELALATTLLATVSKSAFDIFSGARQLALARGDDSCDKRHIVACMLRDGAFRDLLAAGGANVGEMLKEVARPQDEDVEFGCEQPDTLFLGPDAEVLIKEAVHLQREGGDAQLRADHLVLALTGYGEINLGGKFWQVDDHKIREGLREQRFLAKSRAADQQAGLLDATAREGPPGPLIWGCLPLEETIAAFLAVRIIMTLFNFIFLAWVQRSPAVLVNLRTVHEMRILEFCVNLAGFVLSLLAFLGILGHRGARQQVREAAYELDRSSWSGDIGKAFDVVRKLPQAEEWLTALKRGARWLSWLLVWSVLELFIDVPIFGMILVQGNVCRAYVHGISSISSFDPSVVVSPMHCNLVDVAVLALPILWIALKMYMCWCVLALWHIYAFGWTTTDMRGVSYLDPSGILPEVCIRAVAGVPLSSETRPLMQAKIVM